MKGDPSALQQNLLQRLLTNYVAYFLLWLASTLLLILDVIYGRLLLMALMGLFDINYWIMSFLDRAGILLLGLIALCFALFLEHYYREGVAKQLLWPRFLWVSIIQLSIILSGMAASWFATAG